MWKTWQLDQLNPNHEVLCLSYSFVIASNLDMKNVMRKGHFPIISSFPTGNEVAGGNISTGVCHSVGGVSLVPGHFLVPDPMSFTKVGYGGE